MARSGLKRVNENQLVLSYFKSLISLTVLRAKISPLVALSPGGFLSKGQIFDNCLGKYEGDWCQALTGC